MFKVDLKEDRGQLDLTRQIDELRQTIKGYEFLLDALKLEIPLNSLKYWF